MRISVKFACGHTDDAIDPAVNTAPACQTCGETRVARVKAPPPTFRGAAKGPHAVKEGA